MQNILQNQWFLKELDSKKDSIEKLITNFKTSRITDSLSTNNKLIKTESINTRIENITRILKDENTVPSMVPQLGTGQNTVQVKKVRWIEL